MKNTICCPNSLTGLNDKVKIFAAGPIQGAPLWQHELPEIEGAVWISPRRLSYDNFDYDTQTEWETTGLRIADIILFWIPEPVEDIAGRGYAQTTRIEFGENIGRHNKQIVTGIYPDYNGRKYFVNKSNEYRGDEIYNTLEECIEKIKELVSEKLKKHIFFTSDTHFSSERAMELSKRPFFSVEDMDWTMIDRWNSVVGPNDTVYHLGDFGESWPMDYLNGKITFIRGNYERDGKSPMPPKVKLLENQDTIVLYKKGKPYLLLSHEPTLAIDVRNNKKEYKDTPIVFGHIHGRQKVKEWCGLDVGVDSNNFTPMSQDDVDFYINAIQKGYYDQDVWS